MLKTSLREIPRQVNRSYLGLTVMFYAVGKIELKSVDPGHRM